MEKLRERFEMRMVESMGNEPQYFLTGAQILSSLFSNPISLSIVPFGKHPTFSVTIGL